MSQDTVRASQIASASAASTATGNALPGPRGAQSMQLSAWTTGTSGVGATVVWQAGNDGQFVAISSATVTASQAGTATSYASAAIASTAAYAYARAVIAVTGTGNAQVSLAN